MQLLVSVRSAAEARNALAGGADIIDAKEPSRGSLGAVSTDVLHQICHAVPHDRPVSIALGDVGTAAEVLQGVSAVPRGPRPATYLKLGFSRISNPEVIRQLLRVALDGAEGRSIRIIAVAYADAGPAESLPPELVCRIAADAGVAGILFDTYEKGHGDLLTWLTPSRLLTLVAAVRAGRLLTAVAGGLGVEHLPAVLQAGPDIIGFRGALCVGGRVGNLSRARVRSVRRQLTQLDSDSLLPAISHLADAGETPGDSAILDRHR